MTADDFLDWAVDQPKRPRYELAAGELVMMAPEPAIRKLWEKTGWKNGDVDLYEINEAFSVQQVAMRKVLDLDPARHNVHGGAVALGHPIGCSGSRVLTTLGSISSETLPMMLAPWVLLPVVRYARGDSGRSALQLGRHPKRSMRGSSRA